jgi:hypothetical protein
MTLSIFNLATAKIVVDTLKIYAGISSKIINYLDTPNTGAAVLLHITNTQKVLSLFREMSFLYAPKF